MTITETYNDWLSISAPSVTINAIRPMPVPRPHDLAYSPVSLHQLDGNLNDSVGSNTLTLGAGTLLYGQCSGLSGAHFNSSTYLQGGLADPTLLITGDMTLEFLYAPSSIYGNQQRLICESGDAASDAENTNTLWAFDIGVPGTTSSNSIIGYFCEYSASGTNESYASSYSLSLGLTHFALTRESNVISIYQNGSLLGTSGVLNTPTTTGSPAQRLFIGGQQGTSNNARGFISSVKLIKSALTVDQILREVNYTLFGGA